MPNLPVDAVVQLESDPGAPSGPPPTSPPSLELTSPPQARTEPSPGADEALADDLFAREETLLWATLSRRWPQLAAHLTGRADHVEDILNATTPADAPIELRPLFTNEEVLAVARGEAPMVGAFLTPNSICRLTEA